VRINTFNRAMGYRLKAYMVDFITSDIVENEEIARGYSVAKDRYGQVEDNELAEISIEIEQVTPKASVDDRYRDTPLYFAPEDEVGTKLSRSSVVQPGRKT
jgi:non-homologous end joining protein Ku